jgi:integrase
MPQRQLTDRFCQTAKSTAVQTDYYDAGSPGLALRVGASGRKTWTLFYSFGGARRRLTLGTYPATSLASARTKADEVRAACEAGKDPQSIFSAPASLRSVCDDWLAREGSALRTSTVRAQTLARLVYPALGSRPIASIRRSDVIALCDDIEATSGAAMADKTLAFLRRAFNWYALRNEDFVSPIVRGMSRDRSPARARILTDDELRVIWRTAETFGTFGRLVRFLLLTAARRTEAAGMPWTELTDGEWLLPSARNKTKLDLLRPLSPSALDVIGTPSGAFVFPNARNGHGPLRGYGTLKEAFDDAVTAANGGAPLAPWTLHDLRRTARSLMSRAGVPSDHAERCLGHVIGGIRGTYDRHNYAAEKATALAALARIISDIVTGTAPNVVRLRRHG